MARHGRGHPNTEEGKSASDRGRERYAQKDYQGAVDAFSEAIQGSTEHLLLNALDNRAACWEKLGRYKLALADSKRMIEIMPRLSKGYLRCGKVLQLTGNTKLAAQIYERGLSKVKIDADQDRVKMQTVYNKLRRAMRPTESLDPLDHLPSEIAVMVCHYLSMRDRVVCLFVSKAWKSFLESQPDLWTVLDTTYCRKSMSKKSLQIHLRRSKYTLDTALITMKANIDWEKMRLLTRTCKELREVRILGQGLIGESLSDSVRNAPSLKILHVSRLTEASLGTVQSCMRTCKQIEDMKFGKVQGSATSVRDEAWTVAKNENIKSLELQSNKKSRLDMGPLVLATPNLATAILVDWKIVLRTDPLFDLKPWSKLEYLDLTNTQLRRFPMLPSTIRHLILADNPLLAIPDVSTLLALEAMPSLETFNVHQTTLYAHQVKHLVSESIINGHLKRLYLGGRLNATHATPADEEFPSSETVQELSLALLHLDDNRVLEIADLYPKLKKLDVSGTNVTGVAVKELVKRGVTSLKLDECSLCSSDAVEFARGKGVEVSYNFPSRAVPSRFANSGLAG